MTVTQADEVYRLGNWEYSYIYRDAANSTLYSALKYGAWVLELRAHLEGAITGESTVCAPCCRRLGRVRKERVLTQSLAGEVLP